jgi:hypothetical protein
MTAYPQIGLRVDPDFLRMVDAWRRDQHDTPTRPEAIRRLVELGLTVKVAREKNVTQRARAKEMAAGAIDKLTDATATSDDQEIRKRRLLKGPEEFREVRVDRKPRK